MAKIRSARINAVTRGGALVLGTALVVALAGCSGSTPSSSAEMPALAAPHAAGGAVQPSVGNGGGSAPGTAGVADAVTAAEPDIVDTGTLTLNVKRSGLDHAFDVASEDAAAVGGYVSTSDTQFSGTSNPYADLVVRVPAARFEAVVLQLSALGSVQQKQLGGQDVTGQVVDLGARITNLESEETALRQLMARTGSIPDILTVENQLFSVEQQIEELTAQSNDLADQVAFATITLDLETAALPPKPSPKPPNAVAHGARLAVHNTAAALHDVAIAVGAAFPAVVLAAALALLVAWRRRRGSRRSGLSPAPAD